MIRCAAIKTKKGKIYTGMNHSSIHGDYSYEDRDLHDEKRYTEGFLDSENNFHNREEAMIIAKETKQVKKGEIGYEATCLESWMLA